MNEIEPYLQCCMLRILNETIPIRPQSSQWAQSLYEGAKLQFHFQRAEGEPK